LPGHHVWLVVLKGTLNQPSSTESCWQNAGTNEGIEDCYGMNIITSSFKTEFTRKSQVVIVQIWEPKRIGKTSEEELK
jgi:hypothetical protein